MQLPVQSSAFASVVEAGGLLWNLNQLLLEFPVVPFLVKLVLRSIGDRKGGFEIPQDSQINMKGLPLCFHQKCPLLRENLLIFPRFGFQNMFIRKLNHFQSFHFSNQKMYKNHGSFWNRFLLLLAFIICTCLSALLLFITGFFLGKYEC